MDLSFEEHPELFSLLSRKGGKIGNVRQSMRELISESQTFILRFFMMLPQIDYTIARLYYIERLSQDQISDLLEITQAAVSRRLKFILVRVKFLLKMPTLDPMQVRKDFEELFPSDLIEFGYFFYWESAQNRVKYFIKTSQSGAANKFARVLQYLETVAAWDEGFIGDDYERMNRHGLALIYLDYFRYTRQKSNIIVFLFKKYDYLRSGALMQGPSVLLPDGADEIWTDAPASELEPA